MAADATDTPANSASAVFAWPRPYSVPATMSSSGAGHKAPKKVVIKSVDMNEGMQQDAVDLATHAVEHFTVEKDMAAYIKKEFDQKHHPTWHCVVGKNFGSFVTHETKHFIYFYVGQLAILLFRAG